MSDALACDVCGGSAAIAGQTSFLEVIVRGGHQHLGGGTRTRFHVCSAPCLQSVPPAWVPNLRPQPLRRL